MCVVPIVLRWGHAEPLSESLVASLPWAWKRAYSGVRFTKAEAVGTTFRRPQRVLPWPVRLSKLFHRLFDRYRRGTARYAYALQKRVNAFHIPLAQHSDVEFICAFVQVDHMHPVLIPYSL